MPAHNEPLSLQTNIEITDSLCSHCEGVNRHEGWCITQSENVCYAHRIVFQPKQLSPGDQIILHALGVSWKAAEAHPKRRTVR